MEYREALGAAVTAFVQALASVLERGAPATLQSAAAH